MEASSTDNHDAHHNNHNSLSTSLGKLSKQVNSSFYISFSCQRRGKMARGSVFVFWQLFLYLALTFHYESSINLNICLYLSTACPRNYRTVLPSIVSLIYMYFVSCFRSTKCWTIWQSGRRSQLISGKLFTVNRHFLIVKFFFLKNNV